MSSSPHRQTTTSNNSSINQNNQRSNNSDSQNNSTLNRQQQQQHQNGVISIPTLPANHNSRLDQFNDNQRTTTTSKSAFNWDIYKNRKTALQHLKRNCTLVDTILESEDGLAYEFVHSQVISAFGDKLNDFINQNGTYVRSYKSNVFEVSSKKQNGQQQASTSSSLSRPKDTIKIGTSSSSNNQASISRSNVKNESSSSSSSSLSSSLSSRQQSYWSRWPGQVKLIRLPKVSKYTLGILVECAYSGYIRADLPSGGIWEVLKVANHYEMFEVIRACCTFLIKWLDRSNCVLFYHIGMKHKHQLQRNAWHKIRANFKYILSENLSHHKAINQMTATTAKQTQYNNVSSTSTSTLAAASTNDDDEYNLLLNTASLQQQLAYQSNNHRQALSSSQNNSEQQQQQQHQHHEDTTSATILDEINTRHQQQLKRQQLNINSLATIKYEHFEPLLMHDKLNIENEETIWYAIKLWCNENLSERSSKLAPLLACMRFPRFKSGTDFTAQVIWRDNLILKNKLAQHELAVLDRNHRDYLASSKNSIYPTITFKQRDGFSLPCALNPRQLRPRVPHSILLAIGGWQQGHPTKLIESYDLNCNLWFESKFKIMSPLAYHGIECINNLLYICGGTDGHEILNELFTFDPIRGDCSQKRSMQESRCYVSTAHLNNNLYAIGGHNGSQRMKSAERYDLNDDFWYSIQDMNVARSDASACVFKQLIYIAGGLNDQVIESSVEFYNYQDNTWTFITSMITPRTSFTLLLYKNTLLAIGGNNGSERLSSVEQYNFLTKNWSHHSNMRHRRSTFSAALLDENKLMVVGGYNGQTPFNQVEMYDEQSTNWITMQKIRYDRSGLKVIVVNDLPNANEYTFLGCSSSEYSSGSNTVTTSTSTQLYNSNYSLPPLVGSPQSYTSSSGIEDSSSSEFGARIRANNLLNLHPQLQSQPQPQVQAQQTLSLTARARHRFLRSIGRLSSSPDELRHEISRQQQRGRENSDAEQE